MSDKTVGTIGQWYEDRKSGKVGAIVKRDEKASTLILQLEDSKTIKITYGTFKSNWRKHTEPESAVSEEETAVPEIAESNEPETDETTTLTESAGEAKSEIDCITLTNKEANELVYSLLVDSEYISLVDCITELVEELDCSMWLTTEAMASIRVRDNTNTQKYFSVYVKDRYTSIVLAVSDTLYENGDVAECLTNVTLSGVSELRGSHAVVINTDSVRDVLTHISAHMAKRGETN